MIDPTGIAALLEVAQRAIDVEYSIIERKEHCKTLRGAYKLHKLTLGKDEHKFIKREGPEWEAMMAATTVEYGDAERAKRAEYNARRRLQRAIRNCCVKAFA